MTGTGLMKTIASKFLFFPEKILEFYPSQLEIPFEDIRFQNDEGLTLHGWFFPGKRTPQADAALLYLHGNAGNIGDRLDKIQLLRRFGWSIFAFDYRGYGGSEGAPSIEGVLKDSEAALRYLTDARKTPNKKIVLYGESLGGAMAVHLAHAEPVGAVILESTFTSLRELGSSLYKFIPAAAIPDVYRSVELIRHVKAPVMVIHGTQDEVVPFEMGRRLYDAAPHPKRIFPVENAHHNDAYLASKVDYLKEIEGFLAAAGLS